jgi:ribosomal protein S12 methylthiotransferase accessory factor
MRKGRQGGLLMAALDDILPLFAEDGGLLLKLSYFRRPLWFSDAHLAVCFSNQFAGAAMTLSMEQEKPTAFNTRLKSTPSASAAKAAGLGFTTEQAVFRAVGEAVERFCGLLIQKEKHRFCLGTYREMQSAYRLLDPEALNTTEREIDGSAQRDGIYRIYRLTKDTTIRWLSVVQSDTGEEMWVPAMAGFLGTRPISMVEQYLEQTSGGLSCHQSLEAALLGGLCELVERDAFTAMWLLRCQPPSVCLEDAANASPEVQRMADELAATTFQISVNDLTSDIGIPVYLATLLNDARPYAIVGAGCHPVPAVALEKAFREVLMSVANLGIYAEPNITSVSAEENIRSMHDHSHFYAFHDLRSRFDFYLRNNTNIPVPANLHEGATDAELLSWCLKKMAARGFKVFHNDLTLPEIARCGFRVVKVIVPGLLPLHCYEHNKPVASGRLSDYSSGAILPCAVPFAREINPWSHPFP